MVSQVKNLERTLWDTVSLSKETKVELGKQNPQFGSILKEVLSSLPL